MKNPQRSRRGADIAEASLSVEMLASLAVPGSYRDGRLLYLIIDPSGAKRWQIKYRWHGELRRTTLGNLATLSLAEARTFAAEASAKLDRGIDPAAPATLIVTSGRQHLTFGEFAESVLDAVASEFRSRKHRDDWRGTLLTHAAALTRKQVDEIDTAAVLAVLQPIWLTKEETASRLRGRIERVLDAAAAAGLRHGENPARWRGHLDALLPRPTYVARHHHAAIAYAEVPGFLRRLRASNAAGAAALEFLILTAAMAGEVVGACWQEIDFEEETWSLPAARMKGGRSHTVPLTETSLDLLKTLRQARRGDFIFSSKFSSSPVSARAIGNVLEALAGKGPTVHGFRATFSEWVVHESGFPSALGEAALGHIVGDAAERVYQGGDAFAERRKLMAAWDRFLQSGQP